MNQLTSVYAWSADGRFRHSFHSHIHTRRGIQKNGRHSNRCGQKSYFVKSPFSTCPHITCWPSLRSREHTCPDCCKLVAAPMHECMCVCTCVQVRVQAHIYRASFTRHTVQYVCAQCVFMVHFSCMHSFAFWECASHMCICMYAHTNPYVYACICIWE
jgi:hypothetical protein